MLNMPNQSTLAEVKAALLPHQWAGVFVALDSFDEAMDDDTPDGAWVAMLTEHAGRCLRKLPKIARDKMRKAHLDGHDLWIAWMEQRADFVAEPGTKVIEQMEGSDG